MGRMSCVCMNVHECAHVNVYVRKTISTCMEVGENVQRRACMRVNMHV